MKYCLVVLLMVILWPLQSAAQESVAAADSVGIVERLIASGHISVSQPSAMAARLQKVEREEPEPAAEQHSSARGRVGYRILVFDDNNPRTARTEAQNRKHMIESRFPELRGYVQFNSPYWQVRMGDFRSRSEVEGVIEDMRRAFPSLSAQLRIVRDYINE